MSYPSRRGAGAPGVNGADGKQVEMQQSSGYVQWRYVGDSTWRNLMPLSMIAGADGSDGRNVDLQEAGGWIQWRHQGDAQWQNLVSLDEMRGANGNDGSDGQPGASVDLRNFGGFLQWKRTNSDTWTDIITLSDLHGSDGEDGIDGRSVQLQKSATHIQWRLAGDSAWQNVVALSDLTGSAGTNGSNGIGIASHTITYQQSASGTTPPSGAWTASIPAITKGTYLWTRIVLTLTDGSASTSYAVAYQAADGLPGSNGTNGANYSPGTAVARTVSLATPYQHTELTKPFKVVVNARSTQTVTVAGLVSDKVELRVGPNAASVAPGGAGGLSIGVWESGITGIALMVGAAVLDGGQVTADVPAGWYFQINRLAGTNATIVSCFTQSMS